MSGAEGQPRDEGARAAYEAFAPVYDEFTEHHDYGLWLRNLMAALERHGLHGTRLLDVGCGTGNSFLQILERGWDVTACDIAPSMLAQAKAKVPADARVQFAVADMRSLPRFGEFDLVWCLDDAVNYLLSKAELVQALAAMRANLAPDGILAFDLNTLHSFRTFFAEEFVVEGEGRKFIWRGEGSARAMPEDVAQATFRVEPVEGGREAMAPQIHRERHFSEAAVLEALHSAGLRPLGVYGHHYDAVFQQPLDEARHTKAVYFSQRVY